MNTASKKIIAIRYLGVMMNAAVPVGETPFNALQDIDSSLRVYFSPEEKRRMFFTVFMPSEHVENIAQIENFFKVLGESSLSNISMYGHRPICFILAFGSPADKKRAINILLNLSKGLTQPTLNKSVCSLLSSYPYMDALTRRKSFEEEELDLLIYFAEAVLSQLEEGKADFKFVEVFASQFSYVTNRVSKSESIQRVTIFKLNARFQEYLKDEEKSKKVAEESIKLEHARAICESFRAVRVVKVRETSGRLVAAASQAASGEGVALRGAIEPPPLNYAKFLNMFLDSDKCDKAFSRVIREKGDLFRQLVDKISLGEIKLASIKDGNAPLYKLLTLKGFTHHDAKKALSSRFMATWSCEELLAVNDNTHQVLLKAECGGRSRVIGFFNNLLKNFSLAEISEISPELIQLMLENYIFDLIPDFISGSEFLQVSKDKKMFDSFFSIKVMTQDRVLRSLLEQRLVTGADLVMISQNANLYRIFLGQTLNDLYAKRVSMSDILGMSAGAYRTLMDPAISLNIRKVIPSLQQILSISDEVYWVIFDDDARQLLTENKISARDVLEISPLMRDALVDRKKRQEVMGIIDGLQEAELNALAVSDASATPAASGAGGPPLDLPTAMATGLLQRIEAELNRRNGRAQAPVAAALATPVSVSVVLAAATASGHAISPFDGIELSQVSARGGVHHTATVVKNLANERHAESGRKSVIL